MSSIRSSMRSMKRICDDFWSAGTCHRFEFQAGLDQWNSYCPNQVEIQSGDRSPHSKVSPQRQTHLLATTRARIADVAFRSVDRRERRLPPPTPDELESVTTFGVRGPVTALSFKQVWISGIPIVQTRSKSKAVTGPRTPKSVHKDKLIC